VLPPDPRDATLADVLTLRAIADGLLAVNDRELADLTRAAERVQADPALHGNPAFVAERDALLEAERTAPAARQRFQSYWREAIAALGLDTHTRRRDSG